jgi:hypothetical protein
MENQNASGALTKGFTEDVRKLCNDAQEAATRLHLVGITAVQKAYSADNSAYAEYALNAIPKYLKKPFAVWLKRAGLNVFEPAAGMKLYSVQGVVDKSRQAKVLEQIKSRLVIEIVAKDVKERKAVELKDTPEIRADKAITSLLARMSDKDPEAKAIINNRVTTAKPVTSRVLYDVDGTAVSLSVEEVSYLMGALTLMRAEQNRKAA